MGRLEVLAVLFFGLVGGFAIGQSEKKPCAPCDCSAAIEQARLEGEQDGLRFALNEMKKANIWRNP